MRNKYKKECFGEIYMQLMFVNEGIVNEEKPLPLNEDLDELIRTNKQKNKLPVVGVIEINVKNKLVIIFYFFIYIYNILGGYGLKFISERLIIEIFRSLCLDCIS